MAPTRCPHCGGVLRVAVVEDDEDESEAAEREYAGLSDPRNDDDD